MKKPHSTKHPDRRGFTIVELVIVISVISVLASVLIPTFSGVVQKAQSAIDAVGDRYASIDDLYNSLNGGNEIHTHSFTYEQTADGHTLVCSCGTTQAEAHSAEANSPFCKCGHIVSPGVYSKEGGAYKSVLTWDQLCELYYSDGQFNLNYNFGDKDLLVALGSTETVIFKKDESLGLNSAKTVEVYYPSGIMAVEGYAFQDCTTLTKVVLPEGVTTINQYAFKGCTALKEISLPSSLKTIGSNAFRACSSLEHIIIPAKVETIGKYAFKSCTNLTIDCTAFESKLSGWNKDWHGGVKNIIWKQKSSH